jgi:Domain of unknown function (DUF4153)
LKTLGTISWKIPSLNFLWKSCKSTLWRFPWAVVCALVGSLMSMLQIEFPTQDFTRWVQVSVLGISLFLALDLYSERNPFKGRIKAYWQAALVILLILYALFLPEKQTQVHAIRYILLFIFVHLAVSVSPYLKHGELHGFWQYNQLLFTRTFLGILYGIVLYIGIGLALLALDQLFNVKISPNLYLHLSAFVAGVFHTFFFLAGIPKHLQSLDKIKSYPRGLLFFTEYLLLPLVAIYIVILYAYMLKIIIQWALPEGWVTYLVLAFSSLGILSLLLIYPIREQAEKQWIQIFTRWFYRACFPLIALLFVAISRRIIDYGITEVRYLVLIIACWLLGMAIYFLTSKIKNIKLIPISLGLICFFASFGPWGVFYLAEKSQVLRFGYLLQKNQLLKDGIIIRQRGQNSKISAKDLAQISSILRFLIEREELNGLQPYFKDDLNKILGDEENVYVKEERILSLMGDREFRAGFKLPDYSVYVRFSVQATQNWQSIKGYDYLLPISLFDLQKEQRFILDEQDIKVRAFFTQNHLQILNPRTNATLIDFNLSPMILNLLSSYKTSSQVVIPSEMTLLENGIHHRARLEIKQLTIIQKGKKEFEVNNLEANILLSFP